MRKVLSITALLSLTLLVLELLVRTFVTVTPGGDRSLAGLILKPYRLPVESVRKNIQKYLERQDSRIEYDSDLGWTARRSSQSDNGLYVYNEQRIRRPDIVTERPSPGEFRIVLLGDSLMHGDDVPYQDSLAAKLEAKAKAEGFPVQVLNLAMSGYGIDQAVLRYFKEGQSFAPQIVIAGFQAENSKRNLTLSRALYTHGADLIPFFKPRFIVERGNLKTVGIPTPAPEEVVSTLAAYEKWPLSKHDYFFKPDDFAPRWWRRSFFFALVESFITESNKYVYEARERAMYAPGSEAYELDLAIISKLDDAVAANGGRLMLLHLPMAFFLNRQAAGDSLVYQELLAELQRRHHVIMPDRALLESKQKLRALYMPPYQFHFSGLGNEIIAAEVLQGLRSMGLKPGT